MKKIIRLTESDLTRIVKRVISESDIQEIRRDSDDNDDEMFDFEIDKIKRALHNIKRLAHSDPQTVDHICNMIVNVSLPRLKEFR